MSKKASRRTKSTSRAGIASKTVDLLGRLEGVRDSKFSLVITLRGNPAALGLAVGKLRGVGVLDSARIQLAR